LQRPTAGRAKKPSPSHEACDALGEVASRLAPARPDVFIGAICPLEPEELPQILIRGPADQEILDRVAEASIEIEVVDSQPYSLAELDDFQGQVTAAIAALGFTSYATWVDIRPPPSIGAVVTIQPGLPTTVPGGWRCCRLNSPRWWRWSSLKKPSAD